MLGTVKWINAYRSGDYVGRAVWRMDDQSAVTYDPNTVFTAGRAMVESCVGPGAHTHYWDESADVIGAQLDALVVEAASAAPPRRTAQVI